MPSPKRSTGGRRAQQTSAMDFERSNTTADTFLGSRQRAWMTGQVPESLSKALTAAPNRPSSQGHNFVTDVSASTCLQTTSPPEAITTSPPAPTLRSRKPSTTTENVLPSPSSSSDTRRQSRNSVNIIDLEDEVDHTFAPEGPLTAHLKELVAKLGSFEQVEKCLEEKGHVRPGNLSFHLTATTPDKGLQSGSVSASDSPSHVPRSTSMDQPHLAVATDGSPITTPSKRPQENIPEPRKRLQGLQGSLHKESHSQSSMPTSGPNIEDARSFGSSVDADMQNFHFLVTLRIEELAKVQGRQGVDVERPRLGLLQEACARKDSFYLCLHRLFCLDHKSRLSNDQVPGLEDVHRSGLNVLSFLLVPNEQLMSNAVDWFSMFPVPVDYLSVAPTLQSAHQQVLKCLEGLASHWAVMRDMCGRRRYPPLVDEMITLFKINSFVFLQIIFRAILREIWPGQQDQCFQVTEAVFPKNYTDVMARSKTRGLPSEVIQAYNLSIMHEYERILDAHRRHVQPVALNFMLPPQHVQGPSKVTGINHTHHNRPHTHESGHPPPLPRPNSQHIPDSNTRVAQQNVLRSSSNPAVQPSSATTLHPAPVSGRDASSRHTSSASPLHTPVQAVTPATQSASPIQLATDFRPFASPVSFTNLQAQMQGQWTNQPAPTALGQSPTLPTQSSRNRTSAVLPSSSTSSFPSGQRFQQQDSSEGSWQQQVPLPSSANAHAPSFSLQQPGHQHEARISLSRTGSETHSAGPRHNRFIHFDPSLVPAQPNPTYSALHQAHLASPIMSTVDAQGNPNDRVKCFRFIEHVIMPPEALSKKKKHLNWTFVIDPKFISLLANDEAGFQGAPSRRTIRTGSRLCRIRCIKVASTAGLPSQSEWVVAENAWPDGVAIMLNGISLEVRKKSHYGKDLSIDATRHLRSGTNELTTAVIGLSQANSLRYAIGVELIQVREEGELKRAIPVLPFEEARSRILERSSQSDPDVQVVDAQTVIDLKDPFTAAQFKIPVRGSSCRHYSCFDRDVFLDTRNAKNPNKPCEPEAFKCPICGGDARPPKLIIDGFLLAVREELQRRGRSKVKTIILDESGNWEVGREDEDTGYSSDEETMQDGPSAAKRSEIRAGKAPEKTPSAFIVID